MKSEFPVIFFDGFCNLCNGSVQFIIKRDGHSVFRFASLQSDYSKSRLSNFTFVSEGGSSLLLLEDGKLYEQSTAALRIARKLSGLWSMLYVFMILPSFIRDGIYNYVAKNRYRWFGKQKRCWVPTPELKGKFLD